MAATSERQRRLEATTSRRYGARRVRVAQYNAHFRLTWPFSLRFPYDSYILLMSLVVAPVACAEGVPQWLTADSADSIEDADRSVDSARRGGWLPPWSEVAPRRMTAIYERSSR
jgi:hypothetical protein